MFSEVDRRQITESGRVPEEVAAQVERLRQGMAWTPLARAASLHDGLEVVPAQARAPLEAAFSAAVAQGRVSAFVPASGAGSRLFQSLLQARADPAQASDEARRLLGHMHELAIWPELEARGARSGDHTGILEALFGPEGLQAQALPKGLLPFHDYGDHRRTAFEEHLVEAARLCTSPDGRCQAHFTVAASRLVHFEALLAEVGPRVQARCGVRLDVSFSTPDPRTDTVAIEADGSLLREADGGLIFRPGGHGGLLGNLADHPGDVVLLKNIDNVFCEPALPEVLPHRRLVAGLMLTVEAEVHKALLALDSGASPDDALALLARRFGVHPAAGTLDLVAFARDRLHRPLRVCGMIRNLGQPGGGPFWVPDADGQTTLQIVEGAQINKEDPAQAAILASSTHFNPVEIAASLRDHRGVSYDLRSFVDPESVIITQKSRDGRPIAVFEHPGLWNGAMARWNTLFVEVPDHMFNPVKRLGDLLRPSHRLS